jgi:hypothetical protein
MQLKASDIVRMKYAVYHVIKVNSELIEVPVLLPIESDNEMDRRSCLYGRTLKGRDEYRGLCVNWKGGFISSSLGDLIPNSEHSFNKESFRFQFDLDEDVKMETYFEIREVANGKSIFKSKKG